MTKIRILDDDIINKIAAGEVVERPASVVKELIENSLDAGASEIKISIKKGGLKLISVSDNGCGMNERDAVLALERYATSKIRDMDDIARISTLGFRGEALPSIAAVSVLRLTTRTKENTAGFQIMMTGGKKTEEKSAGCPAGTAVTVENLFFNTPVRLKFMKTETTETSHILRLVQSLALSYHEVSFELNEDGKTVIGPLPRGQSFLERISSLYGTRIAEELLPLKIKNAFLILSGFVTKPSLSYPTNKHQFFMVNTRPVSSRVLNHAVHQAYGSILMNNRHPGIFLLININPSLVDVNIHPTKKEVRFSDENGIHSVITQGIKKTLREKAIIPQVGRWAGLSERKQKIEEASQDYLIKNRFFGKEPAGDVFAFPREKGAFGKKEEPIAGGEGGIVTMGQVNNTYIVAREGSDMLIIDQHAAWERINYETLKYSHSNHSVASQRLLLPITLDFPLQHMKVIKERIEFLSGIGFEISEFGPQSFIIKSVPSLLGEKVDTRRLFMDIADLLMEYSSGKPDMEVLTDEIFKTMACKSSVKGGDRQSGEEMNHLISRLFECNMPYTCPHGRPTIIRMTASELEKRFKRT